MLTAAKSRSQRRRARLWAEHVNGVMHVRRVPPHKLRPALWRAKQTRGVLDVAVRRASSDGPKGGEGGVQGPEQWAEREGSDKLLPVVDERLITDALGLEGVGDELIQMRVARLPQDQRALDDGHPAHSPSWWPRWRLWVEK